MPVNPIDWNNFLRIRQFQGDEDSKTIGNNIHYCQKKALLAILASKAFLMLRCSNSYRVR